MADWVTISSLATAGGTLALAVSTFASVRSANRAARVAELSLLANLRPLLVPSRLDDPMQKVPYADEHWDRLPGGCGVAQVTPEAIYLSISLRNVANGIAVLDGWEGSIRRDASSGEDRFARTRRKDRTPRTSVSSTSQEDMRSAGEIVKDEEWATNWPHCPTRRVSRMCGLVDVSGRRWPCP